MPRPQPFRPQDADTELDIRLINGVYCRPMVLAGPHQSMPDADLTEFAVAPHERPLLPPALADAPLRGSLIADLRRASAGDSEVSRTFAGLLDAVSHSKRYLWSKARKGLTQTPEEVGSWQMTWVPGSWKVEVDPYGNHRLIGPSELQSYYNEARMSVVIASPVSKEFSSPALSIRSNGGESSYELTANFRYGCMVPFLDEKGLLSSLTPADFRYLKNNADVPVVDLSAPQGWLRGLLGPLPEERGDLLWASVALRLQKSALKRHVVESECRSPSDLWQAMLRLDLANGEIGFDGTLGPESLAGGVILLARDLPSVATHLVRHGLVSEADVSPSAPSGAARVPPPTNPIGSVSYLAVNTSASEGRQGGRASGKSGIESRTITVDAPPSLKPPLKIWVPPTVESCGLCPGDNPGWMGTVSYRKRYGLPQLIPTPRMPREFMFLAAENPIGAQGILSSVDHHMSGARLGHGSGLDRAVNSALEALRSQYGDDITVFMFESAAGSIGGVPVDSGESYPGHFQLQFVVMPWSAVPEPGQMRAWVERGLSDHGWSNPAARRADTSRVGVGLGDIAGVRPYIHCALVGPNNTMHASTYVRRSVEEKVPPLFMRHLICEQVLNDNRPEMWGFDAVPEHVSPELVIQSNFREQMMQVGLQRSVINSLNLHTPKGVPGRQVAVVLNGLTGTGKNYFGLQLASLLGLGYLDAGYFVRALTIVARHEGVNIFDPGAVAELVKKTRITANTSPVRPPGSYAVSVNNRWPMNDWELMRVSALDLVWQPAVRAGLSEWLRDMLSKDRLVIASRDTTGLTLPPGCRCVIFNLSNTDPERHAGRVTAMCLEEETRMFLRTPVGPRAPGRYPTYADGPDVCNIDVTDGLNPNKTLALMVEACEEAGIRLAGADQIARVRHVDIGFG